MPNSNSVVGVFDSHIQAEAAANELERCRFDIKKLSIVGRDDHTGEPVVGQISSGDPMRCWGKQGALWGGIWGGLGALGAALFTMGIPQDSILRYAAAVKTGRFVLIFYGAREETEKAGQILDRALASATCLHAESLPAPV